MKHLKLLLIALLLPWLAGAQDTTLFAKQIFDYKGFKLPYRIMYPENYDAAKKYPLIIFLHGSGERGSDNSAQLVHGAKMFIAKNRSQYPAVVIVPQCPAEDRWSSIDWKDSASSYTYRKEPTQPMAALCALVEKTMSQKWVDKKHIYVGGLSMGGMGTFEILWRMPKTFAAAFPICGAGDPKTVTKYAKNTSVWIFHGAKDDVVPPDCSRIMYDALKTAKASVFYTEYPEANHNSWDSTFREEQLMPWLFSR